MAKAVLVMDMPENCFKCKLQNFLNCKIVKGCHVGENRPDWCPLRKLPEKRDTSHPQAYYTNSFWKDEMNAGFNSCLDEILKERDTDGTH